VLPLDVFAEVGAVDGEVDLKENVAAASNKPYPSWMCTVTLLLVRNLVTLKFPFDHPLALALSLNSWRKTTTSSGVMPNLVVSDLVAWLKMEIPTLLE